MDQLTVENKDTLLEAARPLLQYLNDNHNPHCMIVVTPTNVTVWEGQKSTGEILDYLND